MHIRQVHHSKTLSVKEFAERLRADGLLKNGIQIPD
jgi:hypothetical protein